MRPPEVGFVLVVLSAVSGGYLFSSNQLSMLILKSTWEPKLPGLVGVTWKMGASGIKWVPVSFLSLLSEYSLSRPKDLPTA